MTSTINSRTGRSILIVRVLAASAIGLGLAGCNKQNDDYGTQVAGWSLAHPEQKHPIMVSQKPANLSIRVARGSHGLAASQKSQVIQFLEKYRSTDAGNSKIVVSVPSGAPNEVAAMSAVADLRQLLTQSGYAESSIAVEPYHSDHDPQPPIKLSYLRYVAEGPECGRWPEALGTGTSRNEHYHNFGCAQQKNLAAMVANPADLVQPRTMTAAPSDRRDVTIEKYKKGDPSGATRSGDETAKK